LRTPIIAGNWKMYKTVPEAVSLARGIRNRLTEPPKVEVVLCPPFTALGAVRETIKGSPIALGAQDVYWEVSGAFTGEISAEMLLDIGCGYAIIGHSERRQFFGETDQTVRRKVKAALVAGLVPIVCVGEKLEERETGQTEEVVERQVRGALDGLGSSEGQRVVVAYEPVWAIGTGKTATPSQAEETHVFIRRILSSLFGPSVADTIRIQYGGSVKPENVVSLMGQADIDGALVGGASLDVESFVKIVLCA
jgi:triosephosphate isomerase